MDQNIEQHVDDFEIVDVRILSDDELAAVRGTNSVFTRLSTGTC